MRRAGTRAPFVEVFKRLPEAIPVIAKVVEVALVVVALRAVKFWRVDEARARVPPVSVVSPPTVSVPVRFAKLEMF